MIRAVGLGSLLLLAGMARAEIPQAIVVLEVGPPALPGEVAESAPPRFVLLEDGQVFVGGTREILTARLESRELEPLQKQIARVRKLTGLASPVALGSGPKRFRLQLGKGKAQEIVAQGDPAAASPALRPLADLLQALAEFNPADLRPYRPTSYLLRVQPGTLVGGCRSWTFEAPLAEVLSGPRVVSEAAAHGWPSGATPASVCAAGQSYVVTLRPLLPGEHP